MLPSLQSPAPHRLCLPPAGRPEPPADGTHQATGGGELDAPQEYRRHCGSDEEDKNNIR